MSKDRVIPDNVKPYAKSPLFNSKTVPDKLLNYHDLKLGTWGQLHVCSGEIEFFLENDISPLRVLSEKDTQIIFPAEKHYIKVSQDAEFYIEFYK